MTRDEAGPVCVKDSERFEHVLRRCQLAVGQASGAAKCTFFCASERMFLGGAFTLPFPPPAPDLALRGDDSPISREAILGGVRTKDGCRARALLHMRFYRCRCAPGAAAAAAAVGSLRAALGGFSIS